jgi:IS605 OrfB family transposase
MKVITQKFELLPLTRNQKITETSFYHEFRECTKAFQIMSNEFCRIACEIDLFENQEFRNAKGNPSFSTMNRLVSRFRTKQEGLDHLPEFVYMKKTKSGWKAKRLHANRYMNDDGKCYAYDILNKCGARDLNSVKDRFKESWFAKGKKVNHFYFNTLYGLGWKKKIVKRMPIIPAHICDGKSISGDQYKLKINEQDPKKSILRSFGSIKHAMRIVLHRSLKGEPKTMEIVEENGRLFACISVRLSEENKIEKVLLNDNSPMIGLDFGIKDHVIDDQGNKYNFPKNQAIDNKIKNLQRILSTKKFGSNNWHKLNNKISDLRAKQTRSHDHQIHNFTKKMVDNFDAIALEDYKQSEIISKNQADKSRTKKMKSATNKKALEGNIFALKSQLKYKSDLYGKHYAEINPAYTTQDCSECGHRNSELTLQDRMWTCPSCGTEHDRDVNSAKNVLQSAKF